MIRSWFQCKDNKYFWYIEFEPPDEIPNNPAILKQEMRIQQGGQPGDKYAEVIHLSVMAEVLEMDDITKEGRMGERTRAQEKSLRNPQIGVR